MMRRLFILGCLVAWIAIGVVLSYRATEHMRRQVERLNDPCEGLPPAYGNDC